MAASVVAMEALHEPGNVKTNAVSIYMYALFVQDVTTKWRRLVPGSHYTLHTVQLSSEKKGVW